MHPSTHVTPKVTSLFGKWQARAHGLFALLTVALLMQTTMASAQSWEQIPGGATDISVGANGHVWVVGTDSNPNGSSLFARIGNDWKKIPGAGVRIALHPNGEAWVVNAQNEIWRQDVNGGSTRMPGGAKDIGIGANGQVWVIGTNPVPGGFGVFRWNGNGWESIPGGAVRIAVDPQGLAWVVNDAGSIFRFDGRGWQILPGAAKDIGIGANGVVWVAGTDGTLFRWNGSNWDRTNGLGVHVAVDKLGRNWHVNNANSIFTEAGAKDLAAAAYTVPVAAVPNTAPVAPPPTGNLGSVDPIAVIKDKAPPVAKDFLTPLVGVISMDGAEGKNPENPTQLAKLSGAVDLNKVGSSTLLGQAIRNIGAIGVKLGMSNPVPMEITLSQANAELDLAIAFKVVTTWVVTPSMVPGADPRAALKNIDLVLHAKKNLTLGKPTFSGEVTGIAFAQPTKWDSWLALAPTLEYSNEGDLTFGGEIKGACAGTPNSSTKPEDCIGEWDVLKLGTVKSEAALLKLTAKGGALTGIEVAIKKAQLPNGMKVAGALLIDADVTPGAGLVLNTMGSPTLKQFYLGMYKPLEGIEPYKSISGLIDKLPVANMSLAGDGRIIIAPTGLTYPEYNIEIKEPTFYAFAKVNGAGVAVNFESVMKGDVAKILAGNVTGVVNGKATLSTNFDSINNAVKSGADSVPGIGPLISKAVSSFSFDGADAVYNISGLTSRGGEGHIKFTLLGSRKSIDVAVDDITNPGSIAKAILREVGNLVNMMPAWLSDAIKAVPGGKEVLDATVFVTGQAVGVMVEGVAVLQGGATTAVNAISDGFMTAASEIVEFFSDPFDRKTGPPEGRTVVFQIPGFVTTTSPHSWGVSATQNKVEYWDRYDKLITIKGVDIDAAKVPYASQKEFTLQCVFLQNYPTYDCSNDTVMGGGIGMGGWGTTCRQPDGGVRNVYFNITDGAKFKPAVTRSLDSIAKLKYACYTGYMWKKDPGWGIDIGGATKGTLQNTGAVWTISQENTIFRSQPSGWEGVSGKAKRIDVDAQGYAWIVTMTGGISHYNGSTWIPAPDIPGGARDVGVGAEGSVWAIGGAAENGGFGIFRLVNNQWVKIPGAAIRIDVDAQGNAWVVNSLGDVFRYTGGGWAPMPKVPGDTGKVSESRDIAIGKGPWVINDKNEILRWLSTANTWMRVGGHAKSITMDGLSHPFITGADNRIYYNNVVH